MQKVGIVGPGIMGTGIAYLCASCGFDTLLWGRSQDSVSKGKQRVEKIIEGALKRGRLSQDEAEKVKNKVEYTTDLHLLGDCDIVIESIAEDADLKKEIIKKLSVICRPSIILATNTSTKSITELASVCSYPERFIGAHFFNPPYIMRLVEVVKAVQTSDKVVGKTVEFAKNLKRVPVVLKDYPGFIVNHLLVPFLNHAVHMLEAGESAENLKKVTTLGLGHPMGPIELADFIGLDVVEAMGDTLYEKFKDPKFNPPISIRNLVKAGYLGMKAGRGLLSYDEKK